MRVLLPMINTNLEEKLQYYNVSASFLEALFFEHIYS